MIVATAGHINHGKTALVAALTGVDADRLAEERSRGMTIDLGFAYRPTASGRLLGFVDVPGHERFVRNMLAGVGGVDFVLLVVAADDGPMPQTLEHLRIIDLLGISRGAVAISKVDRVAEERRLEVAAQVASLAHGTSLRGASVLFTSAASGEGIGGLLAHLESADARIGARPDGGRFRMAVDRCFVLRGIGVVATGSVFSGSVGAGDLLLVSPAGRKVRVRGLRIHDREVERAGAGERCALHLAGIESGALRRGDWLVAPEACHPTRRLDVRVRVPSGVPVAVRHLAPAHLYLGAEHVPCRIAIHGERAAAPGESVFGSLILDRPIGAWCGDRFILRNQSDTQTIGGGQVVDPQATARSVRKEIRRAWLEALGTLEPSAALARLLDLADRGLDLNWFADAWNLGASEEQRLLAQPGLEILRARDARIAFLPRHWEALRDEIVDILKQYHREHPDRLGLDLARLNGALGVKAHPPVLREALARLCGSGTLRRSGTVFHLASHRVTPTAEESRLWAVIEPLIAAGGNRPPRLLELAVQTGLPPSALEAFLSRATELGWAHRVAKNRVYTPACLQELATVVERLAAGSPARTFSAAEFNRASGIGRNLSIQVLEYFDRSGLTRRMGDRRRLLDSLPILEPAQAAG